jgi:UDP-N-acetylglucosamine 3-dehydrogenase
MVPRILLVGVGRFGKNHLRVLSELTDENKCSLVGVLDSDENILNKIKKSHDLDTYSTLAQLNFEEFDAAVVVTPTRTHSDFCIKLLMNGLDVFVEKPMTLEPKQTQKLIDIATEKKAILMVGHIFRYNKAVNYIKNLIENQSLGKIYKINGKFVGMTRPQIDMGALYTYAVHHIDICNYILNTKPTSVLCSKGFCLGRTNLEDYATLIMNYCDIKVNIDVGWIMPKKERSLEIIGSKRSLICDLLAQKITYINSYVTLSGVSKNETDEDDLVDFDFEEPLKLELLDFLHSICERVDPKADSSSALTVNEIIDASDRSDKTKKEVEITFV